MREPSYSEIDPSTLLQGELVLDADEKVSAPELRAWALACRWRHWRLESGVIL